MFIFLVFSSVFYRVTIFCFCFMMANIQKLSKQANLRMSFPGESKHIHSHIHTFMAMVHISGAIKI